MLFERKIIQMFNQVNWMKEDSAFLFQKMSLMIQKTQEVNRGTYLQVTGQEKPIIILTIKVKKKSPLQN